MKQDQFAELVQLIKQSRTNAIKAVNAELINLYWNVGGYIVNKLSSATWGEKTIERLAEFIQKNHPELKGYTSRGLYKMKLFYESYSSTSIVTSLMSQLKDTENQVNTIPPSVKAELATEDIRNSILARVSWTHHVTILSRTKTKEEREFYVKLCIKENYSVRQLERQINSGVFERVMLGNVNAMPLSKEIQAELNHAFKDSYIFEFLNLPEPHNESDLQRAIISQMKNFILELGKDFLFIGQEYKVQVGQSDFYIDLLFYHRGLQCLVAFELKADKFKPEQLGQLNFYLEALDRDVKKENENPSIGILLCKDKDVEVVEYAMSRSLSATMVSEYKIQLPDKKILQQKLHELFQEYPIEK